MKFLVIITFLLTDLTRPCPAGFGISGLSRKAHKMDELTVGAPEKQSSSLEAQVGENRVRKAQEII